MSNTKIVQKALNSLIARHGSKGLKDMSAVLRYINGTALLVRPVKIINKPKEIK